MSSASFNGFLSGASQYGRWIPDKDIKARAFMGGSTVDFSHALFTEPVITVHSKAMWGGVTIIVPPNAVVEENGRAIMGGFGGSGGLYHSSGSKAASAPTGGVIIKLYGTSIMGGITAIVNKKAPPAQVISRDDAARILQEAPPAGATSQLDVVGEVLGGVFGGLVDKANTFSGSHAGAAFRHADKTQDATVPRTTPGDVFGGLVEKSNTISGKSAEGASRYADTLKQPTTSGSTARVPSSPAPAQPQMRGPTLLETPSISQTATCASKCAVIEATVPSTMDWKQELKELKTLLDDGILTQSEFDSEKHNILNRAR